jgi:uncharacterized membrane protein YozB (DUF420 family)
MLPVEQLPTLNAILNGISALFLSFGYAAIKRGQPVRHKRLMIAALISSALFLTSYLIYHYHVPSKPYPYDDWTKYLYYTILIPHIILAGVQVPFILAAVWHALKGRFEKHKRLTRWVWPVWMFVSVSGVVIYLMLYQF